MDWWLELDSSASFKHFLGVVAEQRERRIRALVSGRGAQGKPMTNDEYHATAGEARALEVVLGMIDKAKKSTASQETE